MPAPYRLGFPATQYAPLTFPAYRPLLTGGNAIAIGASVAGNPAGLALASIEPGGATASLLSIAVAPQHRRRGLGSQLLARLEHEVAEECGSLEAVFTEKTACFEVLRRMFERSEWGPVQRRMMICCSNLESILKAPWMHRSYLPPAFTVFPWSELTAGDELALREQRNFRYPAILSPFREPQPFEPASSLGLRYEGNVAGWLITHVIPPDILRFTSMFVRSDLQKRARAVSLLIESMARYKTQPIAQSVPNGIFNIHVENRSMFEFAERRLVPYMTDVYYSYSASKLLTRATAGAAVA